MRVSMIGITAACLATALAGTAWADTLRPVAKAQSPLHEALSEDVTVSGAVIVGVSSSAALSGARLLDAITLPYQGESACVTVRSRDGSYFARNTFTLPEGATAGWVDVSMASSQQRAVLRGLGPDTLSVAARPGTCDSEAGEWLLPVVIGSQDAGIEVMVNASGASDVFWELEGGGTGTCAELTEGRRISYDHRCHLPASALPQEADAPLSITIHREQYGRPMPAATLSVQRSPAQ